MTSGHFVTKKILYGNIESKFDFKLLLNTDIIFPKRNTMENH